MFMVLSIMHGQPMVNVLSLQEAPGRHKAYVAQLHMVQDPDRPCWASIRSLRQITIPATHAHTHIYIYSNKYAECLSLLIYK